MKLYAIGDVHGCSASLRALVQKLHLNTDDHLIFLGDYIDRGKDSKGVIDFILNLRKVGFTIECLRGNHEQMMLEAIADPQAMGGWIINGGANTLKSFGTEEVKMIDDVYLQFLTDTVFFIEKAEFIFVHAGLNFMNINPLSDQHAMLWIRDWYSMIDYQWLGLRKIVHGHHPITVTECEQLAANLAEGRVLDIDTGCVYANMPGKGQLCAFDVLDGKLIFQENLDR